MLAARQLAEEGLADEQVQADDAVAAAVEENVAEDVANDVIPSPPSHDIPSPSQEQPSPPQQPQSLLQAPPQGADFPTHDAAIDEIEGRHTAEQAEKQAKIYNLDLDHSSKFLSMQEDDSEVQEVVEIVTTAKLITDVVTTASQVSAASATISASKPSIPAAAPIVVAAYTRRRKGVSIRDPEEELSLKTHAETPKVKDKGKGMKRKPQTESEARKNMMIYLKNTAGYKMDFFKGMTYAEICPIFQARFDENMSSHSKENSVNYVDNNNYYSIDCILDPTHGQARTVVDNHNHNVNHSRITRTGKSHIEFVESNRKDFKNHRKNSDLNH
nr:hypothetical protein [Tanacetum cinerariifolium]